MTTSSDTPRYAQRTGKLRGTLIGCGFFAVNQMQGWADADGACVTAICDQDPDRLAAQLQVVVQP